MDDSKDASILMDSSASIAATKKVKLPNFFNRNPDVWFALAETAFRLEKITSQQAKFDHACMNLGEVTIELQDIITDPTFRMRPDCYDQLRKIVTERTTLSDREKLKKLLSSEDFGTSKPSQLLRAMQNYVKNESMSADVLRTLFMQRLPTHVQSILAPLDLPLDKLAQAADSIVEIRSEASINVAQPVDSLSLLAAKLDDIKELLTERSRPRFKGNYRSRSRSRSRNRIWRRSKDTCWYHLNFGEKAHKCEAPCNYGSKQGN